MILTHSFLQQSRRQTLYESASDFRQRIINENHKAYVKNNKFDVFLSHSSLDHDEVLNLIQLFNQCGYSVYVDWIYDSQLNRSDVSKETAKLIRIRMGQSKGLSYLATSNSASSKWCPWELGYFDGMSENSRCCILPVLSYNASSYDGQEYLGLYPYLDYSKYANSDNYDFWVHEQRTSKYIVLSAWLNGLDPSEH